MMLVPVRQIRAHYSADTITMYQAYPPQIALPALARACLSHYDRDLHGDKATWSRHLKTSPVRVQWDPERSLHLGALPHRSLQVGLSGEAVDRYVDDWIVAITDITPTVHRVRDLLRGGHEQPAADQLPVEHIYPLPTQIAAGLNANLNVIVEEVPEQQHAQ